ncbi:helix-turn-helix domain-containing protein [Desulfobacterium sp. N47]|uniref:HTH merR-type domain-containing protein n=1 Tax=uncultured Desulfobacterium sp. TaxID=201089 RepID=E1YMV1_9BACT|nr:hypothetical protein N47_O13140 [uncultured Desulfobacterium sp.]
MSYPTQLVRKVTKATENQLKYWVKIGIIVPEKKGKTHYYSFRDIIKIKLIISMKENGLSLQKIQRGINNLSNLLPYSDNLLTRLIIFTDGRDMFVNEKGKYFSATSMQRFFGFDTEKLNNDINELSNNDKIYAQIDDVIGYK